MNSKWLNGFALVAVALAIALVTLGNWNREGSNQILNVSYDATRELYRDLNEKFVSNYQKQTGRTLSIQQSHGESGSQAQAVIGGLKADVVTLAMGSEIDALHARGLVPANWSKRLPHDSQPYSSTIVFVVRKGNPKRIADWSDLVKTDVSVVAADPHISGNGRLGMMAAWGSVVYRGGDEAKAGQFVSELRKHLRTLNAGESEISRKFTQEKLGDVHLTWENEALTECDHSAGGLEIVYPPVSIRAEPPVAWVDADVAGTRKEVYAKAYLQFLYSDQAQEIIAQHGLRPSNLSVLKKHSGRLPDLNLFPVSLVANSWEDVQVARK
jgi:sulfate/thiosulfate-binding protein